MHPAGSAFALVPSSRDQLHIYDGESWARLRQWSDHEGELTTLVYSADGQRLISASDDGEIVIRDGATGAVALRLKGHAGAVTALAMGPDGGRLVSAASDPLLIAWDINSGEELARYATGEEGDLEIRDLVISADGERVIGWYERDSRTVMAQWSADTLSCSAPIAADASIAVPMGAAASATVAAAACPPTLATPIRAIYFSGIWDLANSTRA